MVLNSIRHRLSLFAGALFLVLLLIFAAPPVNAKTKVACEVRVVARHPNLVVFAWEVKVESKREWDACDLVITFRDEKGRQVHSVRETLAVKAGRSTFSGHDVCDSNTWNRVAKYAATFDCVF